MHLPPPQETAHRPPPHSGFSNGTLTSSVGLYYTYIYIYNFGIFFLVIQIIQWLLFYFGLDSLSETQIFTCFLEGVEREVLEIHPQIQLPLLLSLPISAPLDTS